MKTQKAARAIFKTAETEEFEASSVGFKYKHSQKACLVERKFAEPKLIPGVIAEILSESEIRATLDNDRACEGLLFTPEMKKYCGTKHRILKRIDSMMVEGIGVRGITNTVILEGTICYGEHLGCSRTCLLLWKEKWLKRATGNTKSVPSQKENMENFSSGIKTSSFCQTTSYVNATFPTKRLSIKQYTPRLQTQGLTVFIHKLLVSLNQKVAGFVTGKRKLTLGERTRTPTVTLGLKPGEYVEVKSLNEIRATLDRRGKNRGLAFNPEMLKYCGKRYKVLKRVDKMVIEPTDTVRQIANTVLLEDVTCDGQTHGDCPRMCYCLWREIWLKRAQ